MTIGYMHYFECFIDTHACLHITLRTYYNILIHKGHLVHDTYNYYFIIFGIYIFNVKTFCDWFPEIKMISVHE